MLKPAVMNETDWPSPAVNLSSVEQQIKKILAATGVDVPSLAVGGNSPATLPLPLAVLVSLTITYKLDKASERCLTLVGPALNSLAVSCPWPSMPILASLWAQKVRRWNDFIVFSASQTVFHHNNDAVVQLLRSCFTSTLGCSPHASSTGGVGALLGHGFGSHFLGGISPVAPGILYLRVHRSVRDVMFVTEVVLSLLMTSVRDIANSGFPRETVEKLKKTKYSKRYGEASLASAMTRVKLAASLGASLVWISGGLNLIQSLIKEILPSWFISAHGSEQEGTEPGGMLGMLRGYALAYFAMLCGTFAWGVESTSGVASKRRPKILRAHLEFLASALDGKISLGCDWATARAYVLGFISLMVACSPAWVAEVDVDVLKRLAKGLRQLNEEELALALLGHGGVSAMSTAAELILETGS
uniref:Mediator of RNA polymerase II transcription subunit 33B-like isoform X1 n=1 Tax=Rhizophora mucronata TaxID=61149 RepID=A0A2P2LN92_RHIMU